MSNGQTAGVPTQVPELRRIENRLDELHDMLAGAVTTAVNIRESIIGLPSEAGEETKPVPEPQTFVARINTRIDRMQDIVKRLAVDLEAVRAET